MHRQHTVVAQRQKLALDGLCKHALQLTGDAGKSGIVLRGTWQCLAHMSSAHMSEKPNDFLPNSLKGMDPHGRRILYQTGD